MPVKQNQTKNLEDIKKRVEQSFKENYKDFEKRFAKPFIKGFIKGFRQGVQDTQIQAAKELLQSKMSLNTIKFATGLSLSEIKELAKEMKKKT